MPIHHSLGGPLPVGMVGIGSTLRDEGWSIQFHPLPSKSVSKVRPRRSCPVLVASSVCHSCKQSFLHTIHDGFFARSTT
jgi:hypothetical protein